MELQEPPAAGAYFGSRAFVNSKAEPAEGLIEAPLFTRATPPRRQLAASLVGHLLEFSSQYLRAAEIPVTIRSY